MHYPCNRLFLVIIPTTVSAGLEQRRGAKPERAFIQFAKRWILPVCHLFHPFLGPCVSDYCHKSKHIHFCPFYAHIVSRRPFYFSLHFSSQRGRQTCYGVYRICSILFFNLSKSAVWLVAKSFLLPSLRGLAL